ncbi:MAG: TIGR01906 family membrane protein [Firmicutes bacterium]|nr:TIGR01906 family membrane protein [Bacillota bacterium]
MKQILSVIFGWMTIVCVVVFSVSSIALDTSFYTTRYEKYNFAPQLGVSREDLNESIEILLDYLVDERDDIHGEITLYGKKQETFNKRETDHMVDVKALYQNALKTGYTSAIGMVILLVFFIWKEKKKWLAYLTRGFLIAMAAFVTFIAFIGIWCMYDFTAFWNWFHTIFFTNDLWLLDPRTDFMINMLPEIIFSQLVQAIVFRVLLLLVPVSLFSLYYRFKKAPIGFWRKP